MVIALFAMLLTTAQEEDWRRWDSIPAQEEMSVYTALDLGTRLARTTYDDGSMLGGGWYLQGSVSFDPTWSLFAEVRSTTYLNVGQTILDATFLWLVGLAPLDEDRLTTLDLLVGGGARLPLADWLEASFQLGIGIERYKAETNHLWTFFGYTLDEFHAETEGLSPIASLRAALEFRVASWMDLDLGVTVDAVARQRFDLERNIENAAALEFGVAFWF